MKINRLEIENVKRIKAVKIEPNINGLTIIGGKNGQGKTSVLDAIAWALGGDRFKPSQPQREGSVIPPSLHIVMDNGLIVERKGKNSDLKVIDPKGNKGGQQLLNEFISQLALDLPRFLNASGKEKAETLLQIIGVGDKLYELEQKEAEVYNKRHAIGQIADQKEKYALEQPYYPQAPKEPVSASELIKQQQAILAQNGENERKRANFGSLQIEYSRVESRIDELELKLQELMRERNRLSADLVTAEKTVQELKDESTAELEASITNIENINREVRANLDKDKAEDDAKEYRAQYSELTGALNSVRKEKTDLLNNADLPLPGLTVENGELLYKGYAWDSMSSSDQLRVATAIVRKINPNCGFVLLDKLEKMDIDTLREFGEWLEAEGLQVIATRVSTGDECEIIIEDGYAEGKAEVKENKTWKEGTF